MSDVIIRADSVSKRYVLRHSSASGEGLRHVLHDAIAHPFRRLRAGVADDSGGADVVRNRTDEFWALRDVSFEVSRGEVVGIIGRNGAGKSTLLKVLSRITEPTRGRVELQGRVASLLEVGTGFHPELSGRENIFLNGAILGMTRAEIRKRFDEIVAFAEVERFLDTPVKRYSSGMYVRLAFAVAAHLEPEILIVDEVLAVGDMQFQKKCLGKMQDVAAKEGRTVLFVSHNMVAVQSLCRRAMLLEQGRVWLNGPVGSVVNAYLKQAYRAEENSDWPNPESAPGNEAVRIRRVRVVPEGRASGLLTMRTPVRIETEFWILQPGLHYHLTYHLLNDQGITVLTTGSKAAQRPNGIYRSSFIIPADLLNSGDYSLKLLLVRDAARVVYTKEALASFTIVDTTERGHGYTGREPGIVQPPLTWQDEALDGASSNGYEPEMRTAQHEAGPVRTNAAPGTSPIFVTKTWLPPLADYIQRLESVWRQAKITNHGPAVVQLEEELRAYLGAAHLCFLNNGTSALQLALRGLEITGEVITTPYSYVATTSAILWEGCQPVFVDINERTFCIDPQQIEAAITPRTRAILATHVYGYPCDVDAIERIARQHGLRVIYDAAHAFGVRYRGRSLTTFGDAATLSFHATKLFHTVEGGAIVCADAGVDQRNKLMRSFGHVGDEHFRLGINAKNSELHAIMGLCNLTHVSELIAGRERVSRHYDARLAGLGLGRPVCPPDCDYAYAYYPVMFRDEAQMLRVKAALESAQIYPRRYFYPSLNTLPYVSRTSCPVSESAASRVLCLPLYPDLALAKVEQIAAIVGQHL